MDVSMDEATTFEVLHLQAEICKSLGDAKRLMIIHELRSGEKSVTELTEAVGVNQSNMSQHLGVLRRVGLVACRRQGSTVYYSLASQRIAEACDIVGQVLMEQIEGSQELATRIGRL
jgi:DNA-binding transcriptional ArsR family regulator